MICLLFVLLLDPLTLLTSSPFPSIFLPWLITPKNTVSNYPHKTWWQTMYLNRGLILNVLNRRFYSKTHIIVFLQTFDFGVDLCDNVFWFHVKTKCLRTCTFENYVTCSSTIKQCDPWRKHIQQDHEVDNTIDQYRYIKYHVPSLKDSLLLHKPTNDPFWSIYPNLSHQTNHLHLDVHEC